MLWRTELLNVWKWAGSAPTRSLALAVRLKRSGRTARSGPLTSCTTPRTWSSSWTSCTGDWSRLRWFGTRTRFTAGRGVACRPFGRLANLAVSDKDELWDLVTAELVEVKFRPDLLWGFIRPAELPGLSVVV